jgi:hypothetical protein
MMSNTPKFLRAAAVGIVLAAGSATAALAQTTPMTDGGPAGFDPQYDTVTTWNTAWDAPTGTWDRHHILVGTVTDFKPFRMTVARADGNVSTIDLKQGTIIRPTGTTPSMNQRVAVFGYWSDGTFIANRVLVHG